MSDGACLYLIDVHTRAAVFAKTQRAMPWPYVGILVRADYETEHVFFATLEAVVNFIRNLTPDNVKISCAADENHDELERLVTGGTTLQ